MPNKKQMIRVLQETVDFYSEDTNRRAVVSTESGGVECQYATKDGRNCAVGRMLNPETAEKYAEKDLSAGSLVYKLETNELTGHLTSEIQKMESSKGFKPEYQGLPISFLQRVQHLHDCSNYWGINGLSLEGEIELKSIHNHIEEISNVD